jgi:hypothetical protein
VEKKQRVTLYIGFLFSVTSTKSDPKPEIHSIPFIQDSVGMEWKEK